jgi:CBS-domain-containing membrane protein
MTVEAVFSNRVSDAMVVWPKTHGPESGLEEIRTLFEDDHVHMALIIAADGRLLTTIERSDITAATPSYTTVVELGTLVNRTVAPSDALDSTTAALRCNDRRRLAVVDDSGRLLGLLCLRRDRTGYCSDEDIRDRANDNAPRKRAPPTSQVRAAKDPENHSGPGSPHLGNPTEPSV